MTEDQFLERYTTESLKVMARRRGMPQATNASKAALISFLTPRLFSHEANQRLVQALPQRQRRILSVLKTRGNEADTVALAASVEGDTREIASDIRRLVELGLLLYPREEHSRLYRLGECGRVWMDRTAAEAVEPLAVSGPSPKLLADPPAQVREANLGLMLADLFVFLQHLERHPYQPGKSAAEDVNEWSDLAAAMLVPTPVPPGPGLAGGDRLLFLYGLLEEADLLKVKGGRLRPAESAARFFHLEPADQARQVLSAWLHLAEWNEFDRITELIPRSAPDRRQESDRPGSGRVMQARKRVLATLKRFEPGRWYAFSALLREIKKTHPGFLIPRRSAATSGGQYLGFGERGRGDTSRALDLTTDWDRVEGRFVARVLMESLHWLGAVSLGFDDTAEDHGSHLDAFRLTNAGALLLGLSRLLPHPPDDGGLLVQPDFTMMVLSSFPDTGLLHDLSRFSEYTGGDRVIRFTLNRPAAQRGFRNGWTTVKILERLESAAGQPVLGSLASRLEDWERSFNRFRIVRQVTLLEDTDGLLAQALAGSDLAGGLGEPLAPGLFRPDATALPRLFRRLKKEKVPVLRFDHAQVGHGLRLGPGLKIRQHPRGADWITTALLERVAIRQEDDQAVWKLDKKKVQAALKEGLPARHLREQMEERSQ
ncbi:MAG: hypothetical protein ACE5ID_09840, partial [Acidobacteriota bacterium]